MTTDYERTLAAFDAAQAALTTTGTEDLLEAAYTMTHRIHEASEEPPLREESWRILRQQRDMINAEILRRTGEAPDQTATPMAVSA